MSTIKNYQWNNKRTKVDDFYYARPNVWSELPKRVSETHYISCLTPSFFTDLKRSCRERMAVISDAESLELLMSDLDMVNAQFKIRHIGCFDGTSEKSNISEITENLLKWIFDEKLIDERVESTLDIVTDGSSTDVIVHAGSFEFIMENFYKFVTKYTDYKLSHIVTLYDQIIATLETMFLDPSCCAYVDDLHQLRLDPAGHSAVLGYLERVVKLILGYIEDMAYELDKELTQIEEN